METNKKWEGPDLKDLDHSIDPRVYYLDLTTRRCMADDYHRAPSEA